MIDRGLEELLTIETVSTQRIHNQRESSWKSQCTMKRSVGRSILSNLPYVDQVIVIDDGSSDAMATIADLIGAFGILQSKEEASQSASSACCN